MTILHKTGNSLTLNFYSYSEKIAVDESESEQSN